jgi:hypothetical protein
LRSSFSNISRFALMSLLIFASSLSLVEFSSETIFFVAHNFTSNFFSVPNVFVDSLVSRPGLQAFRRCQVFGSHTARRLALC